MVALKPLPALSLISILAIGASSTAVHGSVNTWKDWACPPPTTAVLSLTETQYVPVTATQTEIQTSTITLYQTIIQTTTTPITETLTTPTTVVSFHTTTETTETTEFQTVVTTRPVTLTATEAVSIYSSTTRLTSLKLCPTRITNPTFTVQAPLPTDWTWGCPPAWICKPGQIDCDFEVGLPDQNFYCAPNECIPAEALPQPLLTWNTDPSGNFTPLTDPSLTVNAIDSYFNMNPTEFGLTYQIFIIDRVVTLTSTTVIPPAPSIGARQFQTTVPAACYDWCNNVLLEAQSQGKTPALCKPGSAFETGLINCLTCIAKHPVDTAETTLGLAGIAPQFQQFLDYCDRTAGIQSGTAYIASVPDATTAAVVTSTIVAESTVVAPPESTTVVPAESTVVVPAVSVTTVAPSSAESSIPAPISVNASSPVAGIGASTVPITTTATLPTTITSVEGASTVAGSELSQVTIIMGSGNATTTMVGTDLLGATIIFAGNVTSILTSSYVTTITSSAVRTSIVDSTSVVDSSSASSVSNASASTFTGSATTVIPHYGTSWVATLLTGLIALF